MARRGSTLGGLGAITRGIGEDAIGVFGFGDPFLALMVVGGIGLYVGSALERRRRLAVRVPPMPLPTPPEPLG